MASIGKFIIVVGLVLILVGLLITFWPKMSFLGKLPGDILIEKGNFRFYFPLATGLLISIILSIMLSIVFKLFR